MKFFTALAWIFGVGSTIWLAIAVWAGLSYQGSHEQLLDLMKGIQREWPIVWPFLIWVICWTWIFTQ